MLPTNDEWKPTKKQAAFLSLPYSVLEGFYAGSVGAGKSDVLLLYPLVHKMHLNPEFKGLFLRRTFPELKNEIIPRSVTLFKRFKAKYNKNDKVWEFPSGALFFFGHCENEDDVHMYDSMQPNYVAFDELTSFTEWQYTYIVLQRIRAKTASGLPAIARSGSNPGNTGHNWVRKRFIDPCPEGFKLIQGPSGIKRIYIPATIDDNPHIDPAYRKSLEALPESEKQAKLYGNWSAYEGSVFDEFRDKQYPDEPDNALHWIEPFDIPEWWPRICVGDWGYAAMTWIGWAAISPTRRVYLYIEQVFGENKKEKRIKISEWAPYVREFIESEKPRVVKFCRSAAQSRGQEHTVQQQISEELGVPIELSDNSAGSRVAGKLLLHEYLRWRTVHVPTRELKTYNEEHAQWLFRNRSLVEYKAYLASFNPVEAERNIPKLQIFNTCTRVRDTIKACVYDKTRIEDVAQFEGDDPYDGLRYLIDAVERFYEDAENEFDKIKRQDELGQRLANTGDWTGFYHNIRVMENTAKRGSKTISRYSRRRQ